MADETQQKNVRVEQFLECINRELEDDRFEVVIRQRNLPAQIVRDAQFEAAVEAIRTTPEGQWSPRNLALRALEAAGILMLLNDGANP